MHEFIRLGDELLVVKLDRLGRSTRDVLNLAHELEAKGAALTVLEPAFSTKDATGSILVTVLGMVAGRERRFIRERQQVGIDAAREGREFTEAGSRQCRPIASARCTQPATSRPRSRKSSGCSRMHVYRLTG